MKDNHKFYLILCLSALAHLVVIYLVSRTGVIAVKAEKPKTLVQAKLHFMPVKKQPSPAALTDKPIKAVAPISQPETQKPIVAKPQKITETKAQAQAAVEVEVEVEAATKKSAPQQQARFDPKAGIQSLISEQQQVFFDSIPFEEVTQPVYRSTTTLGPDNQKQIKAIFETAARIDPDTRLINYNGSCVQIKRVLDHNGFSQFQWSGTTLNCGQNDKTKQQLQLSLSKFLKKQK